jgi:gluconate 2-dehydrogenase alpha chain
VPDVVIVGLGPAGLSAAQVLAAAGLHVVALEAGGADADPGAARDPLAAAAPTVRRRASAVAVPADGPAPGMNAVGGAKHLAAGQSFRLEELWPDGDAVARDAAYARVEAQLDVGPAQETPWTRRMAEAASACGWRPFAAPYARRPAVVPDGVECWTGACALELIVEPGRAGGASRPRVAGVRFLRSGTVEEVRARTVVLAAGVCENVRLLLLSGGPRADAFGPWVGRGFTTHAFVHVRGRFPDEDLGRRAGTPAQAVAITDLEADTAGGSIVQAAMHPGSEPDVGAVWAQPRQRPRAGSVLDLDPTYTDPRGRPVLRVTHDLDAADRARRGRLVPQLERWLRAAGAGETWVGGDLDDPEPLSTHLAGGTVAGRDPRTSVVDHDLRAHAVDDLVVLGSSVFPHSAGRGPTLTIEALADHAAHRLAARTG